MPVEPDKAFLAVSAFALYAMNGGFSYVFGVFLPELVDGLNCSKVDVSIASAIQIATCLGCGVMAGGLVELLDCHVVSLIGSTITAIGIFLNSFVQHVTHFYITHGLITGLGMGLQFVPIPIVIQRTFSQRHRAGIMGFVICGNGFGTFIGAPIVQICINYYGWRGTYLLSSAAMLNGIALSMTFRTKFKKKKPMESASPPPEPEENTLKFCISGKIPLTPLLTRSFSHENAGDGAKLLDSPSKMLHQKWITSLESGSGGQSRFRSRTLGGDQFRSNVELYLSGMGSVDNMANKTKKLNSCRHVLPNDNWLLNRKYNSEMCIKQIGNYPTGLRFSCKKNSLILNDPKISEIDACPRKSVVSSCSNNDFSIPFHKVSTSTIRSTPLQSVADVSKAYEGIPTIAEVASNETVLVQSNDATIVANESCMSHTEDNNMLRKRGSLLDSSTASRGDLRLHFKNDDICNGHMMPHINGDIANGHVTPCKEDCTSSGGHVILNTDNIISSEHVTYHTCCEATQGTSRPQLDAEITTNGHAVHNRGTEIRSNGHMITPCDEGTQVILLPEVQHSDSSTPISLRERLKVYLARLFDVSILKNTKFLLLLLADFMTTLSLFVPITFMVYKAQLRGIDPIRASALVSVYGISDMFGRFLGGVATMKLCPVIVMCMTDLTASILAAVSGSFDTFPWMVFFSITFALASGGHVTTSSLLSGEVFDVERIHKALGLQYTIIAVSISLSYPISAAIWETTGDVEAPFYYVAVTCALGSLITLCWYIYHEVMPRRWPATREIMKNHITDTVVL